MPWDDEPRGPSLSDMIRGLIAKRAPLPPLPPSPLTPTQQALDQQLATLRERPFQGWYAGMADKWDLNPNPDDPSQFYDYRGAFMAGARPDAGGHWPSDFKKPGHPNMVVGGFNVQTGERVPGTRQATERELIDLGWDPAFARQNGRR